MNNNQGNLIYDAIKMNEFSFFSGKKLQEFLKRRISFSSNSLTHFVFHLFLTADNREESIEVISLSHCSEGHSEVKVQMDPKVG